jgi:hypothetical protein
MKALLLTAALLSGCATCRDHPTACAVGTAVVVGSVAAFAASHDHHEPERSITPRYPMCQPQGPAPCP